MKQIVVIIALVVTILIPASGQKQDEAARRLGLFESDLLTAILNRDNIWLERLFAGRLSVIPSTGDRLETRVRETTEMIDPKLKPEEMKVRISGNITLLTNSATQTVANRSYYFLDTFNKRGGKWQIIATHFSRAPETNNENTEQIVLRNERERIGATVKKDFGALNRILADDFVAVESSGRVIDKAQTISGNIEFGGEDVRTDAVDIKVKVYGDTAVTTGRLSIKGKNRETDSDLKLLFTSVWVKRDGQWQAINYQATRTK
jgi:ketosteroid isomerase-like protein